MAKEHECHRSLKPITSLINSHCFGQISIGLECNID